MKTDVPKQFLAINGVPVLVHTLNAFLRFDSGIKLILVLPRDHFGTWEEIRLKFLPKESIAVVEGGASRYQSVKNGLAEVEEGLVAIHDAVRPCVSDEVIRNSFLIAKEHGSGIVTMPLKDSIRQVSGSQSEAKDRSAYRIVQTPQTFQVDKIKLAFQGEEKDIYTDDATVFEHVLNEQVTLVDGDYKNIKITTQEDLAVAELFLKSRSQE